MHPIHSMRIVEHGHSTSPNRRGRAPLSSNVLTIAADRSLATLPVLCYDAFHLIRLFAYVHVADANRKMAYATH